MAWTARADTSGGDAHVVINDNFREMNESRTTPGRDVDDQRLEAARDW